MRLIDADALMGVVTKNSYMLRSEHNTTDYGMFLSGIKQAVDEAPTVDAGAASCGNQMVRIILRFERSEQR